VTPQKTAQGIDRRKPDFTCNTYFKRGCRSDNRNFEIHQDAIEPGQQVLIVDDLIATGGTAKAVAEVVEKMDGHIIGLAFMVELSALKGRQKLTNYKVTSIIKY
jgi:adenine phosphoribosyltransferase